HVITAVYSGDSNFLASSQSVTEQSNATNSHHASATVLSTSANPVLVGQPVAFTATVRDPAGARTPTRTITFFVGNIAVARVRLDANGQARIRGVFTISGRFTIRAVYSGDANFDASSQSLAERVINRRFGRVTPASARVGRIPKLTPL